MSKREALVHRAAPAGSVPVWRSVDEKKKSPAERSAGAAIETGVKTDGLVALAVKAKKAPESDSLALGRRGFLVASGAAAAAGIAGCARRPAEEILPYTRTPEFSLPGIPTHFATALSHNGETLGVIVEQHEGRPTKIEGNPAHSASNPGGDAAWGSTDVQTQAAILGLYDEDRSGQVMTRAGEARSESSWEDLDEAIAGRVAAAGEGEGMRFLVESLSSPTVARLKAAVLSRFPGARFHTWSPVNDANAKEGVRIAWGDRGRPLVDYSHARVVLSLDCDFLGVETGAVRSARLFAAGRRMRDAAAAMSRLYAVEATTSLTGQNADQRLRIASSDVERYAHALARALGERGVALGAVEPALGAELPDGVSESWVAGVAQDLVDHAGEAVIVVGSRQPPAVHALAHLLNEGLRAFGGIVELVAPIDEIENDPLPDLRALVDDMGNGVVRTLFILGGNPVYDAPADLAFGTALSEVEVSVHLASHDDETSELCTWHVPMAHELESWGDHRSLDGTIAVQQPLIAPLRGGRNAIDLLAMVSGADRWRAYDQVRQTFVDRSGSAGFDRAWRQALHRGVVAGVTPDRMDRAMGVEAGDVARAIGAAAAAAAEGWEVTFVPDLKAWDGRAINNPWLLELPDPITKATWDNAALISPASAEELGVTNGALLRISRGDASIEIPACIAPGHADRSVTLTLGWGRTKAGSFANGFGTNVYPLRASDALHFARGFAVEATGAAGTLVITQEHHSLDTDPWIPGYGRFDMPERPAAIVGTLEEYRERPNFAQWREPTPSVGPLWTEVEYGAPHPPAVGGTSYSLVPEGRTAPPGAPPRHMWGMVVDLSTCTGCSACVVACNAENNLATVGRDQVALGREMHWMRIDRYFIGEDTASPVAVFQPVACQHCEEAPCENVCPVNATEHSPEGINEMAYNRCIGTRYCMNNCPYKVRRFNFLAYQRDPSDLHRMQFNPNVSVRMRGVMEKCNFCVQRIQAARIAARNAHSRGHGDARIGDGDVVPACAQACPSQALVFGDLNDPASRVAAAAGTDRGYKLLASVGTQPRTTYLARVRNPNPEVT